MPKLSDIEMHTYNHILDINNRFYREHAKEYIDSTLKLDLGSKYKSFLKLIPLGGSILDAGCGSGRDSKYFADHGYIAKGIDASPSMVSASLQLGLDAVVQEINNLDIHNEFDGVWACASLLHLPKEQLSDALHRIWKSLKPDGVLFVSLKQGIGESISEDGRFFAYYSPAEFRSILFESGSWEVCSETIDVDSKTTWINFLATVTINTNPQN